MTRTVAMLVVLAALGGSVAAQTTNPSAATNPPPVVTVAPPKVVMPPDPSPLTNSLEALKPSVKIVPPTTTPTEKPDRPANPTDVAPPTDVKNLVEKFQRAREDFIARQRAATALPREQLTEQQRQKWEEERARLRLEIRDRVIQIRSEFRSRELLEVLDAAREAAKPTRIGEDK